MTDILIIGGGPAGLTAAIYAARAGRTVVVCERETLGGQITQSHQVDNYPGLPRISGMELSDAFCAQAMDAGAEIAFASVESLVRNPDGTFTAQTDDEPIEAKAVIFATGARPKSMGIDQETALIGKGISYCALCDGAFFKGKNVVVVGGGNTAFADALFLSKLCNHVTLVHRRDSFRAEQASVELAKNTNNITLMTPYAPIALSATGNLTGITVKNTQTNEEKAIPASAVFVAFGRQPDCSLILNLADFDEQGYVASGENCSTKTPGLFVAGDCRSKDVRQLTTETADGTIAATAACEYLDKI